MSSERGSQATGRIPCAILGATGLVGQVFASTLARHEWFEPRALVASAGRAGDRYGDVVDWRLPSALDPVMADKKLSALDAGELADAGIRIVFSGLPRSVAVDVEADLRERGFCVFSNAGAYRRDDHVPILIPEVNADHLGWIEQQGYPERGFVVTNANCTTTGLAMALAPLRRFGIAHVIVSTYQALSGAGIAGLEKLDEMHGAIPHIDGEEEKVAWESQKILGTEFPVSATCVRVPVDFGHLESVWVDFDNDPGEAGILEAWRDHAGPADLPSLPEHPLVYLDDPFAPRHDQAFDGTPPGMVVYLGRLEHDRAVANRYRFVLLVNNIVRGAAGGSVANAEWFVKQYPPR